VTNIIAGAVAVGSGGVSWVVTQAIKLAARIVVNKIGKATEDLWKTIRKGDYFTPFADAITGVTKVFGAMAASCFVVVFVLLLLASVIISAFSVEDATKVATSLEGRETLPEGLPAFGGLTKSTCKFTGDTLDLTFANNSSSGAARRGYDLVTDLMRGFWCYWNHQPDYDSASDPRDLFDEIRFEADAFPGNLNSCADCLFWCTWLPYIAYNSSFDQSVGLLSAEAMTGFFRSQTFFEPNQAGQARSGDIVFFRTGTGGWHVAMVYYVLPGDGIMTIHSNAPYKQLFLTLDGGTVQDPAGFLTVVGIGRPK
jgi:hypothetical protein